MILYYVGGLLGLVSMLFFLLFMLSILTGDPMSGWLPILIFAYVFSPFGLPVIAAILVAHIELLRDWTIEVVA
ncbi:MAG: CD1845 family protein [Eubacteriales bacterium]